MCQKPSTRRTARMRLLVGAQPRRKRNVQMEGTGCEVVRCIHLAQNKGKWWNTVKKDDEAFCSTKCAQFLD